MPRDPQCEVHEYLMGDGRCSCTPPTRTFTIVESPDGLRLYANDRCLLLTIRNAAELEQVRRLLLGVEIKGEKEQEEGK